jgi:hexosaminidase
MVASLRMVLLAAMGTVSMSAQTNFVNTMLPLPAEVHTAAGSLPLNAETTFRVEGAACAPLQNAAQRMIEQLQNETGVQFHAALNGSDGAATITIKVSDVSRTMPAAGDDESYRIDIDGSSATIAAQTVFGAYRAFATLPQLIQVQEGGFVLPAVHIVDRPRFGWRGLMLDPGRHFLSVATILRTIDGMAAVKLNVLHLHLSENQGFRMESVRYPLLTQLGSEGEFYTQAQMKQIVAYAAERGIRVVPEFDMPGHSTSWMAGYPELGSGSGPYKPEQTFGIFDATMDPTRESTYEFLDQFFGEMAEVFPDRFVHIGGDESNGKEWRGNPQIVAFMKAHGMADTQALQAYFNKRVQAILAKYHRTMVGWDEVLHPDLSPDVVIQNWHGVEFLINGARQGHEGLLSQPWYLDHHYTAGQMFAADPVPANSDLTAAETKLILGGEACVWGEQIVDATIDAKIWPRAAAVAERLWSAREDRDTDDLYRRLRVESLRLDALGLQHLSGPQRALRAIAGARATPELDVFAAAVQPVDFGVRSHRQHNTRSTPMTHFVDAVRFDPPMTEDLAKLVDAYLSAALPAERADARQQMEAVFRAWIATGPALDQLAEERPQVAAVGVRRRQLVQLGHLGLDAVRAREDGAALDATKLAAGRELLHSAASSDEELLDFVVLAPLHKLLDASAGGK